MFWRSQLNNRRATHLGCHVLEQLVIERAPGEDGAPVLRFSTAIELWTPAPYIPEDVRSPRPCAGSLG